MLAGLVAWLVLDGRQQQRLIDELDARGIRRRSDRGRDLRGSAPMRLLAWPLAIFAVVALLFALALLSGDPSRLPSALIGRPAPGDRRCRRWRT